MEKIKTYDNGLRLVVKTMPGLYTVSLGILVNTGSINETAENNGISHYIEHMLFKGTEKRSAFEISDSTERLGSQINAYTAKENTCYYVKSTKENFRASAEILSDLFFNSVFDDEESAREKGVIQEEIHMCDDAPEDLCFDLLAESYFGKSGLGRTVLGTSENVDRFTKEDILSYMDKYYVPENVVVSIAGNITFSEAEKICDEFLPRSSKGRRARPALRAEKRLHGQFGQGQGHRAGAHRPVHALVPPRLENERGGAHTQHRVRRGHEQPPVSEYPRKIRPRVFGVFLRFAV